MGQVAAASDVGFALQLFWAALLSSWKLFNHKFGVGGGFFVGPTCEVLLKAFNGATLDSIDVALAAVAERVERTRKGRVWDVWVGGRPVHVAVGGNPPAVALAAGCNGPEDFAVLRRLAGALAAALGGVASEPEK